MKLADWIRCCLLCIWPLISQQSRPTSAGRVSPRSSAADTLLQAAGGVDGSGSGEQCLSLSSQAALESSARRKLGEHIQVDPRSGRRSFSARLVALFSCLGSEMQGNDLTLDYRLAKPAIQLAVERASARYPDVSLSVSYRTAPDICRHQQAAGHAADEYYGNGANYFLGPGCSESMASVGQLASYWNVPMCSTGYLPKAVTARFRPLTLMQLSLSVESVGELLVELFQLHRWRHLTIVTDDKHPLHSLIRDGLLEFFNAMYLLSSGGGGGGDNSTAEPQRPPAAAAAANPKREPYYINITARNFASSPGKPPDYESVMLDAAGYSRIMLLLARSSTVHRLLEVAHRHGMSKGQFVFIAHELFETQTFREQRAPAASRHETGSGPSFMLQDRIEIVNSTNDRLTREIFAPLLTISLPIPTTAEFNSFRLQVAQAAEREFNYRIEPASLKSNYSLGVAAFIYDCVMLYADKLHYILNGTQLGRVDGTTVFQLTAGNTSRGALTGDLKINSAGQRVIDFTLNDFAPGSMRLEPVAHFMAIERRLVFLAGRALHWQLRNQSAPRSDPRCRHSDQHCRLAASELEPDPEAEPASAHMERFVLGVWLLLALLLSVGLSSSGIGWFVYRRFRIESELLNLWWSIKYEDILFEDEPDASCDGKRSMSSLAISNESFNVAAATGLAEPAPGQRASPQLQPPTPTAPRHDEAAARPQDSHAGLLQAGLEPSGALSAAHSTNTLSAGSALDATESGGRAKNAPARLGPSRLIPLITRQRPAGGGGGGAGSGSAGSHKLAAAGSGHAHHRDPSITSQNKNVKLRLGTVLNGSREQAAYATKIGLYKASRVAVKHLNIRNLSINRQLLIELRQVRDLTHENLIKFVGLSPEEPHVAIVSELCSRGNLQDLLQNESIRLDWAFRYSIINDIVDGLLHLHQSAIQFHGRLKSSNCVIDNRFVVKLTDFGLATLLGAVEPSDPVNPRLLLWTAPEHLRTRNPLLSGSQKGDIYSLAIIFQEIITRCGPFECEPILLGAGSAGPPHAKPGAGAVPADWAARQQQQPQTQPQPQQPVVVQHKQRLEPDEIVNLVRMGLSPPFRPFFRPDVVGAHAAGQADALAVADLIQLVQACWQEAPAARPSMQSVRQQFKKMRHGQAGHNLMDNLLQRMERYTDNLESLVEQKTAELMEEKKRSEELLYEMLPRFVVDQLKYGHSVTPEAYEAVTISFSDIKDFTSIAAQSSPIEVVNLLNQLYTEFDDCIARYDVYKVETIGDAYMVVSGLPVRNGDEHARQIGEMSLALLELIENFHVAHLPHVNLELRIGIHSGPCASGVVGTRMFRYCLFGDTVNTASRMESHGEPMKIHISEDCANILEKFGNFHIEPRGTIEIKGKGLMNTFWLLGQKRPSVAPE